MAEKEPVDQIEVRAVRVEKNRVAANDVFLPALGTCDVDFLLGGILSASVQSEVQEVLFADGVSAGKDVPVFFVGWNTSQAYGAGLGKRCRCRDLGSHGVEIKTRNRSFLSLPPSRGSFFVDRRVAIFASHPEIANRRPYIKRGACRSSTVSRVQREKKGKMVRKRGKSGASSRNLPRSTPSEGDSGQKDRRAEPTTTTGRRSGRTRQRPSSFAKAEDDDTRSVKKKKTGLMNLVFIHDHGLRAFELSWAALDRTPAKMEILNKVDSKTNGEWTAVQAVKRACGLLERKGLPREKDGEAYARDPSLSKGEKDILKLYWITLGHGEWVALEVSCLDEDQFKRSYDRGEMCAPDYYVVDLRSESEARCLEREQKLRAAEEEEYRAEKEKRREARDSKKTKKSGAPDLAKEEECPKETGEELASMDEEEEADDEVIGQKAARARAICEREIESAVARDEEEHAEKPGSEPASLPRPRLRTYEDVGNPTPPEGWKVPDESTRTYDDIDPSPPEFVFSGTYNPDRNSPPTEDEGEGSVGGAQQPYLFDDGDSDPESPPPEDGSYLTMDDVHSLVAEREGKGDHDGTGGKEDDEETGGDQPYDCDDDVLIADIIEDGKEAEDYTSSPVFVLGFPNSKFYAESDAKGDGEDDRREEEEDPNEEGEEEEEEEEEKKTPSEEQSQG